MPRARLFGGKSNFNRSIDSRQQPLLNLQVISAETSRCSIERQQVPTCRIV